MVPLHGYRYAEDLRSNNELWNVPNSAPGTGIYVGPGAWFDWKTHRIHVRLAHTTLPHQENYTGETDPRKLALVLGADHSPLTIYQAAHVRLQDLVVRGSATRTVEITSSTDIELDGLTIYGGTPALWVGSSDHLRVVRSALRGDAAPWSSRASMKYRGASPYLFIADNKRSLNHDWELAYNEFTDGHDGLVLDSIKGLRFHHNRVDNFNDDGIYLTLPPRKNVPEDVQIYENLVTRVYTTLAFAETERGHGGPPNSIGTGVYIYRNVFGPAAADVWLDPQGRGDGGLDGRRDVAEPDVRRSRQPGVGADLVLSEHGDRGRPGVSRLLRRDDGDGHPEHAAPAVQQCLPADRRHAGAERPGRHR